jgi:hypothetical protein
MLGNGALGRRVACDEGQNLTKLDGQKQARKSATALASGNDIRGAGGLSYDAGETKVLRSEGSVVSGVTSITVCFFAGGVGCKTLRFLLQHCRVRLT